MSDLQDLLKGYPIYRFTAYQNAYKGKPVHAWYRRNYKGQAIFQPPPRLRCLDKDKKFRTNNACPICRDEYLFFDYRVGD